MRLLVVFVLLLRRVFATAHALKLVRKASAFSGRGYLEVVCEFSIAGLLLDSGKSVSTVRRVGALRVQFKIRIVLLRLHESHLVHVLTLVNLTVSNGLTCYFSNHGIVFAFFRACSRIEGASWRKGARHASTACLV